MSKLFRSVNILFLVAVGALVVMNFITREHLSDLYDVTRQRAQARQRVLVSQRYVSDLLEAESHQRAYLLTQDESFRERFEKANQKAEANGQELMTLLQGYPEQQSRMEYARTVVVQKVSAMRRLMDNVKSNSQVRKFPLPLPTDEEWEIIPKIISDMADTEIARIDQKELESQTLVSADSWAVTIVSILTSLLAIFAFVTIERTRRKKASSQEAESKTHEELLKQQKRSMDIIHMQQAITTADWTRQSILDLVLEHSVRLTEADGAIIQSVDNDEIVYEATWGLRAPPKGHRIPLQGSLAGNAIQRNEAVICHDSETDPRVNREACRRLGVRSMIVIPFTNSGKKFGALKVYSHQPGAFSEDHKNALNMVSGILSSTVAQLDQLNSLRETEAQLVRAKDLAESSTRAKSQFLANMSHEIRTPLNGILGIAEHLESTPLTPEQLDCVKTIGTSGESLLAIINDILDFSKIEAGMLVLASVNFNLLTTFRDLQKLFSHSMEDSQVDLVFEIDPDLHTDVKGDPGRLMQILLNLVGNAIKFTPQGQVTVGARTRQDETGRIVASFEIRDTGVGIAQDAFDKLFQAFQQGDTSTSRNHGGTGLGLSICKHLITQMDGQIGVRSQLGRGSTFWFNIRLDMGQPVYQTSEVLSYEESSAHLVTREAKILLVEDNAVNQKVAFHALSDPKITIYTAASGIEALDLLGKQKVDLVLMDCQMPEMDGYETTRRIRNLADPRISRIPIIALTAHALVGDREKCLAAGMDDYVSKPFKAAELLKVVQNWLATGPGFENPDEIFKAYLQIMPAYVESVQAGYWHKDWKKVSMAAHSIKSSSANIGAFKLGRMAELIEGMANQQPESIQESTITAFGVEYRAVSALLEKRVNQSVSLEKIYPLRGISLEVEPTEKR